MQKRKQTGFTLIELITVIIILGLVASMGGMLLTRGFTSANKFNATNDPNYWQGTIAYERMVRDLREMLALTSANNNSISYLGNNGKIITYSLSGSSLVRTVGSAAGVNLANTITSLSFSYYNASGQSTNTLANVRCINIVTILTQPTQSGSSLQTLVCPRNFVN